MYNKMLNNLVFFIQQIIVRVLKKRENVRPSKNSDPISTPTEPVSTVSKQAMSSQCAIIRLQTANPHVIM
jgi:hypothetical protein